MHDASVKRKPGGRGGAVGALSDALSKIAKDGQSFSPSATANFSANKYGDQRGRSQTQLSAPRVRPPTRSISAASRLFYFNSFHAANQEQLHTGRRLSIIFELCSFFLLFSATTTLLNPCAVIWPGEIWVIVAVADISLVICIFATTL